MKTIMMDKAVAQRIIADAAWPVTEWGTGGTIKHEQDHLLTIVTKVPDGMILLTRCCRCGAKIETLVDIRRDDALAQLQAMADQREATGWIERHARCDTDKMEWSFSGRIEELVEKAREFALEIIQSGEELMGLLSLETEDGSTFFLPTCDLPNHEDGAEVGGRWVSARTVEVTGRYAQLRMKMVELGEEPVMALHFAEAWMTLGGDGDPNYLPNDLPKGLHGVKNGRLEVVMISVVTHDYEMCGSAPIIRPDGVEAGVPAKGSTLGEFSWLPGGGGRLSQGIMARPAVV